MLCGNAWKISFIQILPQVSPGHIHLHDKPQFPGAVSRVTPEVRARASMVAGMTQDRRFMLSLIDAAIYDPDDSARFVAAKALPLLEEPAAIRKLQDIAISTDNQKHPWALRRMACVALRRYGSPEILERLFDFYSYKHRLNYMASFTRRINEGTGVNFGHFTGAAVWRVT